MPQKCEFLEFGFQKPFLVLSKLELERDPGTVREGSGRPGLIIVSGRSPEV